MSLGMASVKKDTFLVKYELNGQPQKMHLKLEDESAILLDKSEQQKEE